MAQIRLAQGLTSRKRRRKPGDLAALRRVLWQVILEVEALIETPPAYDTDAGGDPLAYQAASANTKVLTLKAAHALAQLSGAYTRVLEESDLEARLAALEAAVSQRRNGHGHEETPRHA